jgi:hypothetical protein
MYVRKLYKNMEDKIKTNHVEYPQILPRYHLPTFAYSTEIIINIKHILYV